VMRLVVFGKISYACSIRAKYLERLLVSGLAILVHTKFSESLSLSELTLSVPNALNDVLPKVLCWQCQFQMF
jgi:hypothetical protein